jgi:hypothetical protein
MLMKRVEQQGWHVTHDAPPAALPAARIDVALETVGAHAVPSRDE